MALNLADIEALFVHHSHYSGKPVTQLAHTLQTALLAEEAGADDERVPAALPHDLGHPVAGTVDSPTLHGEDGLHQFRAVPFLWGVMPDRVPAAIQRHMAAKRFLCATRPGYLHALSSDAHRSFALQGGGFRRSRPMASWSYPGRRKRWRGAFGMIRPNKPGERCRPWCRA